MREIKFRAWLKKYEEMVDVLVIDFDEKYIVHKDMRLEYDPEIDPECVTNFDECELMQFTGLKDKNGNGNEIYEGDILITSKEFNILNKVIYEKGCFCLDEIDPFGFRQALRNFHYLYEIIGNIHSNPELLESKK